VANTHRSLHLVTPQAPPKPNLDPADIAAAVLETVRDCARALSDLEKYHEWLAGQMRANLNRLELAALRSMNLRGGLWP
jgi:hypothetical protein